VWEIRGGILQQLAAGGCPSSQIAIVAPSAVPLWKVIVGPRADKLQPDPQGSGFSLGPSRLGSLHTNPRRPNLLSYGHLGKTTNGLDNPTLVEICIGLEINGYLPVEF